jgi:putative ABC transport system permease protein
VSRRHDAAGQLAAAGALERAFEGAGLEVSGMQRMLDVRQGILDHLVIITSILLLASVVVVLVGGLTLTSTLALGVVQRTREIGVLGALGATPSTIGGQVWFESVLIGISSWFLAVVASAPIAWALESATGNIFFKVPLDFYMSPGAAATWLGLVIVIASLSGALPALRAARLTVREALAYA